MSESNPRYPHTLSVKRVRRVSGEIVFDADGNVTYETVTLAKLAMSNGWILRDSNGTPIVEGNVTSIPCGYRTTSRNFSDNTDVAVHTNVLHCPAFSTELLWDDVLEITDYDRTYKAKLVRKATFNGGTAIWFDEIMN